MEKHSHHVVDHNKRPLPTDFDNFLPWACFQLSVDATVVITRSFQSQYVSAAGKDRPKTKSKVKAKARSDSFSESESITLGEKIGSAFAKGMLLQQKPVYIETVYDDGFDLVQLKFMKNSKIPRAVMKIIGFITSYHKSLSSIVINSGLCAETIHEMAKFLPTTGITEVCLDCTMLAEANYHILLNHEGLKYLSLSRCKINDDIVKTITAKLVNPCPASKSLSALNLATNRITDVGMTYLAEVLRSNRKLTYLNLSDNMITDDGASKVFEMLSEFPLTAQETTDRNHRLMAYLREKNKLVLKTVKDLQTGDFDKKNRRKSAKPGPVTKKKLTDKDTLPVDNKSFPNIETHYFERAEHIAEAILGPFNDPFGPEHTERRDTVVYCFGNNSLAYLNLAYNNLTYTSLKRLCDVVMTQSVLGRSPHGLINIRIEGNYMPDSCTELEMIDNLLESGLSSYKRASEVYKKKVGSSKSSSKHMA